MRRRDLLKGSAAGLAGLAMPSVLRAAEGRRLTFIPQADLAVLDPVWTTADVTRNHGYLVFDTLYGLDEHYAPQPQMLAGHTVEEDGKRWRLALREDLRFHDGAPVRAADVVASVRRWAAPRRRTRAASRRSSPQRWSPSLPSIFASISSNRSSGRGRLPTCVVRMRSTLSFIVYSFECWWRGFGGTDRITAFLIVMTAPANDPVFGEGKTFTQSV